MSMLHDRRGFALLIVLIILVVVLGITGMYLTLSTARATESFSQSEGVRLGYAAEAGVEMATKALWADYVAASGGTPGTINDYFAWIETEYQLLNGASITWKSNVPFGGFTIASITLSRTDNANGTGTTITVRSTAEDGHGGRRTVEQMLATAGAPFRGFEFALLAKNINCILCHAEFDSVDRKLNKDPSKYGTFDRIKIGSLESLLLRSTSAESSLAGTVFTRGKVLDKTGVLLSDLSATTFKGRLFDSQLHLAEDASGNLTQVDLTKATGSPLPTDGNLYMDYPSDPALMTAGDLPTSFPAAIEDTNGNKMVDDAEFASVSAGARGTLSGGILYGVPSGGTYASGTLPTTSNLAGVTGSYDGNVILVGTDAAPLQLNGTLAFNGDVVIKGKVKGTGQIYAKGNIYIVGDVTYADGTDATGNRTFGKAQDGTKNALALTCGGSIMNGDYLTPKDGSLTDPTVVDTGSGTNFAFVSSEISLFNRMEWTKTQPTLPGPTGAQVTNSTYDPTYKPRYYALGPGDPVYIYVPPPTVKTTTTKDKKTGKTTTTTTTTVTVYWDDTTQSWLGSEHAGDYTKLTTITPGATDTVLYLAPSGGWLSEQNLKGFWIQDEAARPLGAPRRFDGLLYTNNSIFAMAQKRGNCGGKMEVNGAIIAADIGVLSPGPGTGTGFALNYDPRMSDFLHIQDTSAITMTRLVWRKRWLSSW